MPKLAAALSMSLRTLENYIKRYGLQAGERGWSTASVAKVLREEEAKLKEAERTKEPALVEGALGPDLVERLATAQAVLIVAKAEREMIRLAKEKGLLVFRDSVDAVIHEVRSFVRDRCESMVRGLPREIRAEVEPQMRMFLKELDKRTGDLWLEQPK